MVTENQAVFVNEATPSVCPAGAVHVDEPAYIAHTGTYTSKSRHNKTKQPLSFFDQTRCVCVLAWLGQSNAKPMPSQCQADAKPMPSQCQANAKPMPSQCQCQANAKPMPSQWQANAKPMPSQCQTNAKPMPSQVKAPTKNINTEYQQTKAISL